MEIPLIDLNSPTKLVFEWGWLLVTRANFTVYLLLVVVLLLGAFVRLPRTKRELAAAEAATTHALRRGESDHE